MTGSCQIRKGVKVSQNGNSPLTPFTYFVFGVISLVGVNDYFAVVYVSNTGIPMSFACWVTEL